MKDTQLFESVESEYEGGRHDARIQKMMALEKE